MTFDQTSSQNGFMRPVFLNKERQQAYDSQNQNTTLPPISESTLSDYKNSDLAKNSSSNLSLLLNKLKSGNFKSNTNVSNSTPQMAGNLSTDFNKLGVETTKWGDATKFEKFHPGIDIANKIGTPIPAFAEGTVTAVDTGHKQGDKAFGNTITVTDAQGNKVRYSHLSQSYVKVGQKVNPGQEVGTMGNSGQTYSNSGGTGSHLDLRIVDAFNQYVNPNTYLNKLT